MRVIYNNAIGAELDGNIYGGLLAGRRRRGFVAANTSAQVEGGVPSEDTQVHPIEIWDGTTFYVGAISGIRRPSSSAAAHLQVVGPGTDYALGLSPAMYAELCLRVEAFKFSSAGGAATATSGTGTSTGIDPGTGSTVTATAASVTLTQAPLFPADLMTWPIYDEEGEVANPASPLFNTRAQRPLSDEDAAEMDYTPVDAPLADYPPVWLPTPFKYRRAIAPEHNLVLRPPLIWYRADTNDRALDGGDVGNAPTGPNVSVLANEHEEDDAEFAFAETNASLVGGLRFSNIEDWFYGGFFVAETGEHAPGRIWLPFPLQECSILIGAGADEAGPGENAASAVLAQVTQLGVDDDEARIPVKYEYAPGKFVVGEYLARIYATEDGGSTAEITEPPTIIISPAKWFTYGGKYNAETGEPAA